MAPARPYHSGARVATLRCLSAARGGPLAFSGTLTRAAGETVGTHPIQQGTLALNANYNLTFVGANLTIVYAGLSTACNGEPNHQILQPINTEGSSVFQTEIGCSGQVPVSAIM